MDKKDHMQKCKREGELDSLVVDSKRKKIEKDEKNTDCEKSPKTKVTFVFPALFPGHGEISHEQLDELLRYATLGKCNGAAQPSWCHLHHQRHLAGVVVIILQDVSRLHFSRFFLQFRHLRRTFRHRFGLPHPPSNFVSAVLGSQLNPAMKSGEEACAEPPYPCRQGPSVSNTYSPRPLAPSVDLQNSPVSECGSEKCGLTRCLLSKEQLMEEQCPALGSPSYENFVHTGCSGKVTDSSPLFGLDCEMCQTSEGKELVRISLVDADGLCIMDELVKPHNPVLNYLTRFSGITQEILQPVKTRLKDVQVRLKCLLPSDAVLVGHSINNDLQALQMIHPNVIDTAVLFIGEYGRKFKLKFLAEVILGKKIQCEDRLGHDATEDARTALELVRYFMRQGPRKVADLNLHNVFKRHLKDNVSGNNTQVQLQLPRGPCSELMDTLNEPPCGTSVTHPGILETSQLNGQRILVLGRKENRNGFVPTSLCENILCASNQEVLQQAMERVPLASFSIVQFSLNTDGVQTDLTEEINEKMRIKLSQMTSVYAGPFRKHFCVKSVRKTFRMCGPILSLHVLTETQQPYVCIRYEVLEAAQLAVEALNGANVEGCCIKVQRPISELTLDWELILKELEKDLINEDVVYVSGFKKTLTEKDLQQKFSHFKDMEAVVLPQDHKTGKLKKYCFLKFLNPESALNALEELNELENVRSRKALTPSCFHMLQDTESPLSSGCFSGDVSHLEEDLRNDIRKLDKSIYKLYKTLQSNTLCVVLMPGSKSLHRSFSGLCLLGIKSSSNC